MSDNMTREEYWREVHKISKEILDEAGINTKKQHELINENASTNSWVNDFIGSLDVLRNTNNFTEIDSSEEEIHGIKDYLRKAAFWSFYGDIADRIKEIEHDKK